MVFASFVSRCGSVSLSLGPLVSLHFVDSRYFRSDILYQIKLLLLLGDLLIFFVNTKRGSPSTSGSVAIEIADHLPVFTILYEVDQI